MAFTRRSRRFAELADVIDRELDRIGVPVPTHIVDATLNAHLVHLATRMRVEPRWCLQQYAQDDHATLIAHNLASTWRPGPRLSVVPDQP